MDDSPRRGPGNPNWIKGHERVPGSGRAKGTPNKPRPLDDITKMARQYTREAVAKWISLMRGDDKDLAFRAAKALIERGWGGTPLPLRIGDAEGGVIDFSKFGIEEIDRIIAALERHLIEQGGVVPGDESDKPRLN